MNLKEWLLKGAAFAVLAFVILLGGADGAHAQTFNPTYTVCLDDATTRDPDTTTPGDPEECDGDNAAGANTDFTTTLNIPSGDLQFGAAVFFIPPEWTITPGDEIPIGALVGELLAQVQLGIVNGPCFTPFVVGFRMLNASIDPSDTVSYLDTDPDRTRLAEDLSAADSELVVEDATGLDPGDFIRLGGGIEKVRVISASGNRLEVERGVEGTEATEHSSGTTVAAEGLDDEDYFEDRDRSGLQDGFEKYPDFITRVLDDEPGDEVGQPLQPLRRSAGIRNVAGVNVLLQFLIFEPGTFIDERISNDAALGFPTVTLLQNIGDPETDPVPGPISDFCTPLSAINTAFGISRDNGCTDSAAVTLDAICAANSVVPEDADQTGGHSDPDESGVPLFSNPPEGTYRFTIIAAAQRDADGDGIENSLDTCPFTPNLGDPRLKGSGDDDEDGLDTSCDPNDVFADGGTNIDEDLDGFTNRQDNCPLVPNGEEETNQRDTDNDAIGDDCDPNPDEADPQGELIFSQVSPELTIGPGGPPAEDETPTDGDTTPPSEDGDDDGGGLSTGALIGIIVGVIAAVLVLGGGAFIAMRRGGGGGGGTA